MPALLIVLSILDLLICVVLVVMVLFQKGASQGLGSIAGGADTFFNKTKARSIDAMLKKFTSIVAVLFFVLTIVLYLLTKG
jgi:preprotein translocase subunit SecG